MKTFRVTYKEVIVHEFYVDAETESEVNDRFSEMADEGELDWSHGELDSGDIDYIEEI
jgi:hypothetical protein